MARICKARLLAVTSRLLEVQPVKYKLKYNLRLPGPHTGVNHRHGGVRK